MDARLGQFNVAKGALQFPGDFISAKNQEIQLRTASKI